MELSNEKKDIVKLPIDRTVKVLAGPGTGKTRLLVARYLKFVFEDDVPPERLLALTFTKKAAGEMHERVFEEVLKTGDERVLRKLYGAWILNFHQFAHRVIKENAAAFSIEPEVGVASEVELARIRGVVQRRFESGRLPGVPDDFKDDMPSPKRLDTLFRHSMDVVDKGRGKLWVADDLLSAVHSKDLPEYRRYLQMVSAVWRAYERELRDRQLLDFNDLIRIVVEELGRNQRLRDRYAAHYKHILVDEFQDTSIAQNELLRLLSGGSFEQVTVVGDDKQSIYRWRDARVENLRDLEAQEEYLQTNFRSFQGILDLSHQFIIEDAHFKKHEDKIRLAAHRSGTGGPICAFHPPEGTDKSFEEEARALGAWVASLTGTIPRSESPFACYREHCPELQHGDIAILMRSVKESSGLPVFETELNRLGIPFSVLGGISAIEEQVLEFFRNLLQLLIRSDLQSLLLVLEAEPFSLPDVALKGMFGASPKDPAVSDLLAEKALATMDDSARGRCAVLRDLLDDLGQLRSQLDLPTFVVQAMDRAQFFYQLFGEGADLRIVESVSKRLFEMVENLLQRNEANLAALIEAVDTLLDRKYFGEEDAPYAPEGRVVIMTLHQAKGLQFKAVALPGIKRFGQGGNRYDFCLVEGQGLYGDDTKEWGRGCADTPVTGEEEEAKQQEERCLLYVGMTRAEDHLFLSSPYPGGIQKKKENLFASVLRVLPEAGVSYEVLRETPVIKSPKKTSAARVVGDTAGMSQLLDEWQAGRDRLEEARVLTRPVPQGLQFVTWHGLRTFGVCPLQYYYRYVAGVQEDLLVGDGDDRPPQAEERFEISPEVQVPTAMTPADFGRFVHRVFHEWLASAPGSEPGVDRVADEFNLRGETRKETVGVVMELVSAYRDAAELQHREVHESEWPVQRRLEDTVFQGVLDRVDRAGDGYQIIDYKIGAQSEDYEYQLRFYGWALGKVVDKPLSGAVCYLHKPIKLVTVNMTEDDLRVIDGDAADLVEATRDRSYLAKPGKVCAACDYRDICPHAIT